MDGPFCLVVNPAAGRGRSLRVLPKVTALVRDFAGYAVVVANTAYFGAGMKVAPQAEIDDGLLDVVIMRHGSRLAFVRALLKIKDGSHISLPLINLDRGSEVTITASRDLPAAADGENLPCAAPLRSGTPLRVWALPRALRALVPDVSPLASPRPGPPPGRSPGS